MTPDIYLFRNSLRDLVRPKRLVAAAILILAPTFIAVLWRSLDRHPDPDMIYDTLSGLLVFGFLLIILAVVFATGVITQEIEQKTITYLLTRPIPRWRILAAKFLAALVAITATAWIACLLLATVTYGFGGARERRGAIAATDITNVHRLVERLNGSDALATYLWTRLPDEVHNQLHPVDPNDPTKLKAPDDDMVLQPLAGALDNIVKDDTQPLYDAESFAGVHLSEETRRQIAQQPKGLALTRLNRQILVDAFPDAIAPPATVTLQIRRDVLVLLVGALAYGSLFLLLATFLNRPLLWGLLFAFGWESWVPNWPGNFQRISLMSYVRVLAPHPQPDAGDQGLSGLFGAINPETITPTASWLVLGLCIVVFLGLALAIFSWREYVPRDAE